jgi:1,4-dihydroxy-2-naphthoate octaprenyltransferase
MKFFAALAVCLVMAAVLGAGLVLLVAKGQWWLLLLGAVLYLGGFYRFGCKPH